MQAGIELEKKLPLSVVIICKNEAEKIADCIKAVIDTAGEVLVYDNGSTDGTQQIATSAGARVVQGEWLGFGATKKKATMLTKHDWILNLDADEVADKSLIKELSTIAFNNTAVVYRIPFNNYLGKKHLRFGEWGNDKHIRLFNKTHTQWNEAPVHESLEMPAQTRVQSLKGTIHHFTVKNVAEFATKTVRYGLLNAEKYHRAGKKSSWIKVYLAPQFAFVKYYIIKLGFLDGWQGLVCAGMTTFYTFIKYSRLLELNRQKAEPE